MIIILIIIVYPGYIDLNCCNNLPTKKKCSNNSNNNTIFSFFFFFLLRTGVSVAFFPLKCETT